MSGQATLEREPMAKAKGRPKRSERDDVTTKIDRYLVGKAHLIAKDRGISLAELLSEMLRAPVEKAYAQLVRSMDQKGGSK
jgi:hypothetical protein